MIFLLGGGESDGKVNLTVHMLAAAGAAVAAATQYYRRRQKSKPFRDPVIIPRLERTESGRVGQLESFSHYIGKKIYILSYQILGKKLIFTHKKKKKI